MNGRPRDPRQVSPASGANGSSRCLTVSAAWPAWWLALGALALALPLQGQIRERTLGGMRELPPGPAPTGVTAWPVHPTEAAVSWEPASSAGGYHVLRSASAGGPFYAVNDPALSATTTSYVDRGLSPSSTYHYQVQAIYPIMQNSPGTSAAVSVTLPRAVHPASLEAVASGPDEVRLIWPAPPGATGYAVMRYAAYWRTLTEGGPFRGTSYIDRGVGPGTYTYRVIAYYQVGGSELEGDSPAAPEATVTIGPASGTYRVTVTGFTVNRQTADHALQADGKGDEVWVRVDGFEVDRSGNKGPLWSRETSVYGDVQGFPARVAAGTAGRSGGLVSGNQVPDPPWAVTGPAQASRLPLFVWQGMLTEGQDAVFLAPSIWEWDGGGRVFGEWRSFTESVRRGLDAERSRSKILDLVFDLARPVELAVDFLLDVPAMLEQIASDLLGNGGDYPIGWLGRTGEGLRFDGGFLVLDHRTAESIAKSDPTGNGAGVYRLDFRRTLGDSDGSYALWLLVERVS